MRFCRNVFAVSLWTVIVSSALAQKALPNPQWKPGETFVYLVHQMINRNVHARSALSLPDTPTEASFDVRGLLQVEVLGSGSSSAAAEIRLRTWFLALNSEMGAIRKGKKPNDEARARVPAEGKEVECTLQPDGQISDLTGLEKLALEQQDAWREWAAQFTAAFVAIQMKRKRGDKWSGEELETSPSPIDELRWQKKYRYVHDESCSSVRFDSVGNLQRGKSSEGCAVILTEAKLRQKSSPQDATPPDYKLRGLRTRGTANGSNETILYISRKTGMLVRATQEAKQQMDVVILETNGGSQVHYGVTATANSTVELVSDLPLDLKPIPKK
jgi:hypothetical protein